MKQDKTIYWRLFTERVSYERLGELLDEAESKGNKVPEESSKSKWSDWSKADYNYKFARQGDYFTLYTTKKDEYGFFIPAAYTASRYGDKKPENAAFSGWQAGSILKEKFKEINGVSLKVAYGTCPASQYRRFTPRTPYYLYQGLKNKALHGVSAGDYSSQYPANACGILPDFHRTSREKGRALPSKDYPFAFYLKSGHVAEYNKFDTHEWTKLPGYLKETFTLDKNKKPCYNEVKDEDEVTLLMRASDYRMDDVFSYFYDLKKSGDPEAKAVMNMGIGTLHKKPENSRENDTNDYYHVCAVILCRAGQKIIDKCLEINRSGRPVVMIVVDSVTWCGGGDFCDKEKELGAFNEEYRDGVLYSTDKINNYVVKTEGGEIIKECAAGNHKEG